MASEPQTIEVTPESDLGSVLDAAEAGPIRLVRNGVRFHLALEDEDIWAGYDPEEARAGILAASGSWKGLVDAEAFKAYILERRRGGGGKAPVAPWDRTGNGEANG
jgi:hypothetical protein